jgi:hypothetical protein
MAGCPGAGRWVVQTGRYSLGRLVNEVVLRGCVRRPTVDYVCETQSGLSRLQFSNASFFHPATMFSSSLREGLYQPPLHIQIVYPGSWGCD